MRFGKTLPKKNLKIGLIGHGKMGQIVETLAIERGHKISSIATTEKPFPDFSTCDIAIDFSSATGVIKNLENLAKLKKNVVIGTTGWKELEQARSIAKQYEIGVLHSPNFFIGVQLFKKLLKEAARLLRESGFYDLAILEMHHRQKKDAPSGTALALMESVKEDFPKVEAASLRVGHLPGTHSAVFDSALDTITLTHESKGREGFAIGSILAAEWLYGKTGFYTVEDIYA